MTARRRTGPPDGPQGGPETTHASPCRVCGDPAWLSDDVNAVHPCCALWVEIEGQDYCVACKAARALRRQRDRTQAHARNVA
jgi:hypothetical protein